MPPDKFDDFGTCNQLNLVTIVRQLSQLSLISNKLFEELLDDCARLAKRTVKLNEKIALLSEQTSKWNAKKVKIRMYQSAHFKSASLSLSNKRLGVSWCLAGCVLILPDNPQSLFWIQLC